MEFVDWVSVFMALIATASATVTYLVYRSATDPDVIVYADTDKKRPSFVNLMIKNIGNGPAIDVSFVSDRPIPTEAFGIEVPDDLPSMMSNGPLVVGVPYLAPSQELVLTWGQFGGLKRYLGDKPILVTSRYMAPKGLFFQKRKLESASKIDIECFRTTDSSDHNWGPKVVAELGKIDKTMTQLNKAIATWAKSNKS